MIVWDEAGVVIMEMMFIYLNLYFFRLIYNTSSVSSVS